MNWPARVVRPKRGLNHLLAYGQSLSTGWEGWPALSTAPIAGAFMLGGSVRPRSECDPLWQPVGAPTLQPLIATVQDLATGAVLSAPTVANLLPGDPALGETVLEGAAAQWRSLEPEAASLLLASACGVGGRSLEALSKSATPELFNRLRSCVRAARQAAADGGHNYVLLALLFLQGENNSWGLGGTADRMGYKVLLECFYADFVADIAAVSAGQAVPPAMFLYQTGGAYASADNAVAQAQLDFASEFPLCFLAAPAYPVTDKGGHLDANGYRWLGAQFGKVMHRVLALGEAWRPLCPLRVTGGGTSLHVEFHVPVPPLAWGHPFAGSTRADVAQRGFIVRDEEGDVPIESLTLARDALHIGLSRSPGAGAVLRYASAATGGLGCLHDSDPALAATCFVAGDGPGRPSAPAADRAPYPLHNWCAAFSLPIETGLT